MSEKSTGGAVGEKGAKPRNGGACLATMGLFTALIIIPVWTANQLGPEIWHWARDFWPGGVYWFAATAGLAVPLLFLILIVGLIQMDWRRHVSRSIVAVLVAVLCVVTFELIAGAALESMPFGGGRYGSPGGTDTSRSYPGLWAVGLAGTVVGVPLGVVFVRVYDRLFPPRSSVRQRAVGS